MVTKYKQRLDTCYLWALEQIAQGREHGEVIDLLRCKYEQVWYEEGFFLTEDTE